jgi:hypothetical protein
MTSLQGMNTDLAFHLEKRKKNKQIGRLGLGQVIGVPTLGVRKI